MRYIKNEQIQAGMTLGLPFYGRQFEILLDAGESLDAQKIEIISDLGYSGAYVDDAISQGITPRDIIPREMRVKMVQSTMEILLRAERNAESGVITPEKDSGERQKKIIMPVIDTLLEGPRPVVDLIDLKPFAYYNYYHAANSAVLALLLGAEAGLSRARLYELGIAALLHDLGNIFIPKSILNKRGRLTPEEFEIIKSHSQMGFEYLREHFDISTDACMGALQHHENYNGTGYPNKLKKDEISLYARIIAIAEVYDALTSRRPFREEGSPLSAMNYMDENAGILFDPELFELFRGLVAPYPSGCAVRLNDGRRCVVAENYYKDTERPRLRFLDDASASIDLRLDQHGGKSIAGMMD